MNEEEDNMEKKGLSNDIYFHGSNFETSPQKKKKVHPKKIRTESFFFSPKITKIRQTSKKSEKQSKNIV